MLCKDENTWLLPFRSQSSRSATHSFGCRCVSSLTGFLNPKCYSSAIYNSLGNEPLTFRQNHTNSKILHSVYTSIKSVHKKPKWTKARTALISSLQALRQTFFIVNFIIRLLSYSCHPPSGSTGAQEEKPPWRLLRAKGICNESWGLSSLQMTLIAVQAEACWEMANTCAGYGSST